MTEAKDDDLLPQTSPEIIASPAEQEDTPDSADDAQPQPQDREDKDADEE
ncbi:MAG: hypothetical protein ACRDRJ_26670 [Streptosporangiaceae bacterium]